MRTVSCTLNSPVLAVAISYCDNVISRIPLRSYILSLFWVHGMEVGCKAPCSASYCISFHPRVAQIITWSSVPTCLSTACLDVQRGIQGSTLAGKCNARRRCNEVLHGRSLCYLVSVFIEWRVLLFLFIHKLKMSGACVIRLISVRILHYAVGILQPYECEEIFRMSGN
jgi:hypothetical protein